MRLFLIIAGVLSVLPLAPVRAAQDTVTIATWNLRGRVGDFVPTPLATPKPVWRNTFGPRRPAQRRTPIRPAVIEADIVALQGISSLALARRLFPARKYILIVARPLMLHPRRIADLRGVDSRLAAVAVRRGRHVRIVARDFLSELAHADATDGPTLDRVAGIAVRVRLRDRAVWVLSLDLIDGCRQGRKAGNSNADACTVQDQQFKVLAGWLKKKRRGQEAAIVAGSLNRDFGLNTANPVAGSPWQILDAPQSRAHRQQTPAPPPQQSVPKRDARTARPQVAEKPAAPTTTLEQGWLRGLLDRLTGKPTAAPPKPPVKAAKRRKAPAAATVEEKLKQQPKAAHPSTHRGHRLARFPASSDIPGCNRELPHTLDYILADIPVKPRTSVRFEGHALSAVPGKIVTAKADNGHVETGDCLLFLKVPKRTLNLVEVYRRPTYTPETETADPLLLGRPF